MRLAACFLVSLACLVFSAPAGANRPAPQALPQPTLPNDPGVHAEPWPYTTTMLPFAWRISTGSPSITIAVIDTGVSPVADLKGRLAAGFNLITDTQDAHDDNSHGTMIASLIAARHDKVGAAGVCPLCRIMPVKVIGQSGFGTSDLLAQGIRWAAEHGAKVINCSITSTADSLEVDQAIADATAAGAVVVLAAGNNGSSDPAAGGYPAASSPEAIRVAAVNPAGTLYGWSNRGDWVDVAAPGSAAGVDATGHLHVNEVGTSVSAPFVAGLAGLILSVNPSLTPAQVKQIIISTGVSDPSGLTPPRINAVAALTEAATPAGAALNFVA